MGRLTALPADVARLLDAGNGVLTPSEAQRRGVTDDRMRRLRRAELLVRLAHGVYADARAYEAASPWQAFALRSRAFTLACGPNAWAAGWSAVAILGLPAIGDPPDRPLVLVDRQSKAPSNPKHGDVRRASLPPSHRSVVEGGRVTSAPRTVVDVARTSPRADALVVADAARRRGASPTVIGQIVEDQAGWPGVAGARWVAEHADPYAESPLETLGRLTFLEHDLPVPLSNVWVGERPIGHRLDHLLPEAGLGFEGDGALKFAGPDAAVEVAAMREREWRLRGYGVVVVRCGWRLARYDRPQLADRFRRAIVQTPPKAVPVPWWREPILAKRRMRPA